MKYQVTRETFWIVQGQKFHSEAAADAHRARLELLDGMAAATGLKGLFADSVVDYITSREARGFVLDLLEALDQLPAPPDESGGTERAKARLRSLMSGDWR